MKKCTVNGKALGLPFWKNATDVVALARAGRGIVVMPTGTGKTTQTPQALYEAGFAEKGTGTIKLQDSCCNFKIYIRSSLRSGQCLCHELLGIIFRKLRFCQVLATPPRPFQFLGRELKHVCGLTVDPDTKKFVS